jgi:hypothetical protein
MPTPNYNRILKSTIEEQKRKWNNYSGYQNRLAKRARVEKTLSAQRNYWNAYMARQRQLTNYIKLLQAAETLTKIKKRKH